MSNQINGTRYGSGGLLTGKFYIDDTYICSWDYNHSCIPNPFDPVTWNDGSGLYTENNFDTTSVFIVVVDDSGWVNNSTLEGVKSIIFNRLNNLTLHDINYTGSYGSFGLGGCNNITITNLTAINLSLGQGLGSNGGNDIHVKNVYAYNVTGGVVLGSNNSSMENVYVNVSDWMGVEYDDGADNVSIKNATVWNSGHNGMDIHGASNLYVENLKIYNSKSNNIIITGSGNYENGGTWNVTLKDIYTYKSGPQGGTGVAIASEVRNVTLVNLTTEAENNGIELNGIDGLKVLNFTAVGCNYSILAQNMKNVTIIDSDLYNSKKASIYHYKNGTDYINTLYKDIALKNSANLTIYYYPEILIKNSNGTFISESKTQFENRTKPSFSSINEVENKPVLVSFYKNASGYVEKADYFANITTSDNLAVSLSGITPDSSWYRKDPNIPTYTITAIIPNTSSTGPQIIGFAPAENNPFNPGEKKNFKVWANESLTEMLWYVDGSDSPVSKGSLNYTWNITEGNHTIKFIGSNANGSVNKTWYLGGSPDEPSVPGGNPVQEIVFSPADSELTKNVSETVDFSVSPDVFTTKEWYIDGKLIQNNTVSMSKSWNITGTYNVTFSGSGNEDVLHTWTVSVVEEPKDGEVQNKSIITIAPEYQIIEPKKSFDLSIKVEPGTQISGTQLDFVFNSSKASVNNVTEGNLLKQSGANTMFSSGTTNNSAGTVKNIYGFILGTSNVSSPGTMATVNLTAGSKTGIAEFSLSNVLISDADSKSVPYTVTNATVLIDTAPVMSTICCPKSVDEKSTLTFKVSAKDADGDRLTLSASGLPEGSSFNKTSGNFSWTPAVGQAGVYTLTFEVSDGYLTDSENVTVTVNKLNNLPVINSFKPLNGSSFSEGERIEISVNASDAEGQTLSYCIRIDGLNCTTGTEYVWETDYSSSGNHTIEVVVSDGTDEVKEQHKIYISECRPRWDVNEDGVVNILDVTTVSKNYGATVSKPYPRYDVNQDGAVNILDLTLVGNHFGELVK